VSTVMTGNRPRLNPHRECVCGKRGWPTQHDADQVVVNAKILKYLHGHQRRREQRTYQCPRDLTLWHVTSMASYDPPPRNPAPVDVLRVHIEDLLLDEGQDGVDERWALLLAPTLASHVNDLLSEIHQDGLRHGSNLKLRLADMKRTYTDRRQYELEQTLYRDWVRQWNRFQAVIVTRKSQARQQVKLANAAAYEASKAPEYQRHRDAVAKLALAIHQHHADTGAPSDADRALWAVLDAITVRFNDADVSCQAMIEQGRWALRKFHAEDPS
jgi:hypothetical protein